MSPRPRVDRTKRFEEAELDLEHITYLLENSDSESYPNADSSDSNVWCCDLRLMFFLSTVCV